MLGKSAFSTRWLRLPSLLIVLLTILFLVTSPRAAGDITADQVLGQALFTQNSQNLVDAIGFNFANTINGFIGTLNQADGVAVDTESTPQHLYISDTLNSRILGWYNCDSFTNGQAADLVIGQIDMYHSQCDYPGPGFTPSQSNLCFPTGVTVDGSGNLYIADFENDRVVEYNAPYAAYAGLGDTCAATTPCENQLSANLLFGQPNFSSLICNTTGQNSAASNEKLCGPEGVSVNQTTGDLYVADVLNDRVLAYLDPFASGGGTPGTSGSAGDTTADYVFGQTSFTGYTCNQGLSAPTASTLCMEGFEEGGGGVGVDSRGNVYIADSLNNRVLQFDSPLTQGGVTPSTSFSASAVFGQSNFSNNSLNL
jgi:hypothetical protein